MTQSWHWQRFRSSDQIGLSNCALNIEYLTRRRDYDSALNLINRTISNDLHLNDHIFKWYLRRQEKRIENLKSRNLNTSNGQRLINVCYIDFWPNFMAHTSEIHLFLQYCCGLPLTLVDDPEQADILICSCFGSKIYNIQNKYATRILYLGESIKPCYCLYDYSLSHELNEFDGKNIYLPLWILRAFNYVEKDTADTSLFSTIKIGNSRRKDVCIIADNITPERQQQINYIEASGLKVDIYGWNSNPIDNKKEVLSQYLFSLCPENKWQKGYVTEKMIDVLHAKTMPIYWGDTREQNFGSFSQLKFNEINSNQKQVALKVRQIRESMQYQYRPPINKECYDITADKIKGKIEKIFTELFLV